MRKKLVMIPGPTNVPERVMLAMVKPIINHRSPAFTQLYKGIIEKCQKVFLTKSDIIVFTASGSGGVEAAVTNIVRPGDKVLVTVFGEFGQRAAEQVEAAGGKAIVADAPLGDAPRMDKIRALAEANKDIKAVFVVYNETSTGVTFRWLKELGKLASDLGAFYIVDAISILGGDELPVDELGVDICIAGSQKCLAAPPGVVIVSVSNKVKKYLESNPPPPRHYFNMPRYFKFAERGETPFTPALPLFYALDEALTMLLEEGLDNRIRRHKICSEAFYRSLSAINLKPTAKEDVRSNVVLAFNYPTGIEDAKFRKLLDDKFDVLVAGGFGEFRGKVF
ncbi:MAG: alanine--glyoxylate aminotransferase family protein, partial [Nitrososphaerales archaeon]